MLRMERNEHKQLVINNTKEMAVIWSIIVVSLNLKSFMEVNTTKQKPRKLEDAFNICGALLLPLPPLLFVAITLIKMRAGYL